MGGRLARNEDTTIPPFSVPEHGERVHAHIQPNLHDALGRPLVRLPPIPGAHAPRISIE